MRSVALLDDLQFARRDVLAVNDDISCYGGETEQSGRRDVQETFDNGCWAGIGAVRSSDDCIASGGCLLGRRVVVGICCSVVNAIKVAPFEMVSTLGTRDTQSD